MAEPIPWPVYSETMPYLSGRERTDDRTAWAMSPMRPPIRAAAMPAHRASRVASLNVAASADGVPTANVTAESPCQPPIYTPKSTLTRSPSARTRPEGMPCTISELTDMQVTAGNGGSPNPVP